MKHCLVLALLFLQSISNAGPALFDADLYANAVLVARVRLIASTNPTGKFDLKLFAVHTIKFYKNESNQTFEDLVIYAFKDQPGIPNEECTVYLQRYDILAKKLISDHDKGAWILVGGSAVKGVSNVAK